MTTSSSWISFVIRSSSQTSAVPPVAVPVPALGLSFLKTAIPLVAIVVCIAIAKRRHAEWRGYIGLVAPSPSQLGLWVVLYVVWMLATNRIMGWRGPWDFAPWRAQSLSVSVLRVLGVGLLGPIAEELIFRGFLYSRLTEAGLAVWQTIVLLAAAWAALHYSEALPVLALFFVDGVLLGLARKTSRSVIVPIAMHIVWNLFAIW